MPHFMSHCAFNAVGFHYISRDHPHTQELTNRILHPSRNPAVGRRALPERDCAGGGEWFRCRRLELLAVFPEYFQWEWRRELVSCSLARIGHRNRRIPANLKCLIGLIEIIHITGISDIIDIITILRIVVCFQRRHECAFEELGSSVSRSRCWEQEQNPSIPSGSWYFMDMMDLYRYLN